MKRATWIVGVLLLAGVAAALWWRKDDAPATQYRTARIERGSLQAVVSATGTVNPVSQVQVGTQVSGQIKELLVDFNSEVRRDQLIARIDPETFEYRLRQATADLESARAAVLTAQANVQQALAQSSRAAVDLQEGQRDLARKNDLLAQNFISPVEAETARAKVATLVESRKAAQAQVAVAEAQAQSARAAVRQREAALAQAKVDLERTQIRSPVDGIVIKRSVEVGQTVAASLQAPELFVIARNLSDMQVEASIDEADISRVRLGQKAGFTIDAFPGRSFDASVQQIRKSAVNTQNVVTYTVVSRFENPGGAVLPGMTANVRIVTDSRDNVLKVPNAALRVRIAGVEPEAASAAPGVASGVPQGRLDDGAARLATALLGWVGEARAQDAPPGAAPGAAGPGGTNGARAGGPLADLRERLVRELGLDAAQVEKVDALLAEQRPRFAQLRNLAEAERGRERERLMADVRERIAAVLTPPQRSRFQQLVSELAGRASSRGRVHLLEAGGKPRAFDVRLGISDGSMTELLLAPGSRAAQALVEGAAVITAVTGGAQGATTAPRAAGPRPFF